MPLTIYIRRDTMRSHGQLKRDQKEKQWNDVVVETMGIR